MLLLALLPLVAWLGLLRAFSRPDRDAREAFLLASVAWGCCVVGLTETFSLVTGLAPRALAVAWAIVIALTFRAAPRGFPELHWRERGLVGALGALFAATGLTAVFTATNNWDAMTYHMARVAHWAQNRGVGAYRTTIARQIHLQPWAEYAIAQLQILAGTDRLANGVQWWSVAGASLGASLVAQDLGAGSRGQLAAAVLAATTPLAVLESTTTQNDAALAFWLLSLAHFLLRYARSAAGSPREAVALGASAGLAFLTKGTAAPFAFPALAVFLVALKGRPLRSLVRDAAIAVAVAGALDAGYVSRNLALYGAPLGPPTETRPYLNEAITPGTVASNLVRAAALHVPLAATRPALAKVHALFGADLDDPRRTWGTTRFVVASGRGLLQEDAAPNAIHFVFALLAVVAALARARSARVPFAYALSLAGAAVLFATILRFQPWTRLQLPLFLAAAPLGGLLAERALSWSLVRAMAFALLAGTIPYLVFNPAKPLLAGAFMLPRDVQYFVNRPDLAPAYKGAAVAIAARHPQTVGLVCGPDDWEYPLFPLLAEEGCKARIEHVDPRAPGEVDLILWIGAPGADDLPAAWRDPVWRKGPLTLFGKAR